MLLSLDNVSKTYVLARENKVAAVHGVTLNVTRGEFLAITGRSGSGKTTLLNLLAGLARPTTGKVLVDGADLWGMPDREQSLLRSRKMGFIFQFPSLIPSLTVLENVVLPTVFGGNHGGSDSYGRAAELLATVGLSDKLNAFPRQLSAGQQQRVVIARSLVNRPELLFADEPTSNLDEQTEREIMALLSDIHRKMGVTILFVTHTSQLVGYGTRAVRMAAGAVHEE